MTVAVSPLFADVAIQYAKLGLRVHPLRPRMKAPILPAWADAATPSSSVRVNAMAPKTLSMADFGVSSVLTLYLMVRYLQFQSTGWLSSQPRPTGSSERLP